MQVTSLRDKATSICCYVPLINDGEIKCGRRARDVINVKENETAAPFGGRGDHKC